MEELDTDEYIRRIKALNAIKDQYEFTTSIQVTVALQSTLNIDYTLIMKQCTVFSLILFRCLKGSDQSRSAALELS